MYQRKQCRNGIEIKKKIHSNNMAHEQSECIEGEINECLPVAQPETVSCIGLY